MTDFIADAITKAQLSFKAEEISEDYYACHLTSPHGEMKRNIRMKPGYEPHMLGGVLYHYALIVQSLNEYDDILEWAKDRDRDLNEPDTLKDYRQMVEDETDLKRVLAEKSLMNY